MAIVNEEKSLHGSEVHAASIDGHSEEKVGLDSFDYSRGDEALQLVGAERKEHFSEEYNRKLRRKLVRMLEIPNR